MSESDKQEQQSQMGHITKGMSELLIADLFNKHGISDEQRRRLTAEQKQEIIDLVQDLQRQVDQYMQKSQVEQQVQVVPRTPPSPAKTRAPGPISSPAPTMNRVEGAGAPKRKRRMVLRKDK
ncbi:hypothetical protein CIG75_04205 [Tumebacillus algifaecis]|uniref:Spore coat protein n=1 Tax=Tumebacillus algifaecis TaxID=1214604 RepID=A0A223CYE0_9BACL|nr:hypothetical protein [Tumebacillus algifaecis]ASS74265.1 hypothetical protein CIG75_04205 [Tumebacillus algifaecis]